MQVEHHSDRRLVLQVAECGQHCRSWAFCKPEPGPQSTPGEPSVAKRRLNASDTMLVLQVAGCRGQQAGGRCLAEARAGAAAASGHPHCGCWHALLSCHLPGRPALAVGQSHQQGKEGFSTHTFSLMLAKVQWLGSGSWTPSQKCCPPVLRIGQLCIWGPSFGVSSACGS